MASYNEQHDTTFMSNAYTMVSSFRHTIEVERAMQKAMAEKHVTKGHIISCCMTGEFNLNRYLNEFDEEDLKWCYEEKVKILRAKKSASKTK